ncbi:MAG: DUF1232 domain-containing protein [Dehalococcoidia bacterium]
MSINWILLVIGVATLSLLLLAIGTLLMWMCGDATGRSLVKRITRLPFRAKLRLAVALMRDSRIPLGVRAIPALLVLYLAMPIDIIPDFIPVLGHIDDLLILVIGVGLLLRLTPRHVLEGHVGLLESDA